MRVKELIEELSLLDQDKIINVGEIDQLSLRAYNIENILLVTGEELGTEQDEYVILS